MLNQMLNLSKQHNHALEELIENMLLGMAPLSGVKQLLEIYLEVLILNNSFINNAVAQKLESWKEKNTLKVVINKLLKQLN
jgi:hypothetical protein